MYRVAFKMSVKPGSLEEYIKRHNPIWKKLEDKLFEHGARNYSIFLDEETNILFAYAEVEDLELWKSVSKAEIMKEWWTYMKDLMPCNDDNSPIAFKLKEIFHIDNLQ
jgi:L-rhamnose mutarotase